MSIAYGAASSWTFPVTSEYKDCNGKMQKIHSKFVGTQHSEFWTVHFGFPETIDVKKRGECKTLSLAKPVLFKVVQEQDWQNQIRKIKIGYDEIRNDGTITVNFELKPDVGEDFRFKTKAVYSDGKFQETVWKQIRHTPCSNGYVC